MNSKTKWWIRFVVVPLLGSAGVGSWLLSAHSGQQEASSSASISSSGSGVVNQNNTSAGNQTNFTVNGNLALPAGQVAPVNTETSNEGRASKSPLSKTAKAPVSAGACRTVFSEGFESGGEFTGWRVNQDGGGIQLGKGYKGRGLTISRNTPGGEQFTHLERTLPDELAGKSVKVEAMVKYENIFGGSEYRHAGHIDCDAIGSNGEHVNPAWGHFVGTQSEWQVYRSDWKIPPNLTSIVFRIGLQGVIGSISFDDVRVSVCD